jgi:putative ABC transport system permease protein
VAGLQTRAFFPFWSAAMDNRRSANRSMFWRVLRRSVFANRGRLFVILLALGAGAAITAALLNLQVDAKRRITTEFRSFGPNVLITPKISAQASASSTLRDSLLDYTPEQVDGQQVPGVAFLFATAEVTAYSNEGTRATRLGSGPAIIAGYRTAGEHIGQLIPYRVVDDGHMVIVDADTCEVGERAAAHFHIRPPAALDLNVAGRETSCVVSEVRSFGSNEDDQIFLDIEDAQNITGLPNQASLIQLNVPGSSKQIQNYIATLQQKFPEADVRPIRQFTEGEARLYGKISGILTATVVVVLVLTALCVMAAMTNVAMERKNDVGLMKAVGGSVRRVLRLFLAEAALLGLAGGLIGAAVGIVISMGLGKAVFGVAAQPRLIVYPVSVALTVIVAILAAFPLRRLVHIRPASVFRGEE